MYFIDHPDRDRRRWEELGSNIQRAELLESNSRLVCNGEPIATGLTIVHRTAVYGQDGIACLAALAERYPNVLFVVLHGGFQDEGNTIHPRIYCRRWPVDNPIDETFAICWLRFRRALEGGTITFPLLEPTATPYLTALRILLATRDILTLQPTTSEGLMRSGSDVLEELCKEAFGANELKEIGQLLHRDLPATTVKEVLQHIHDGRVDKVRETIEGYIAE